ncbi:MAG: biotin--[acetyl-CoA-carboxylase] ligase [Moraxellaceae bacterium]|nr:biotin--[acetyl-CoA-carboxylase] ligase [Moraxellaceae bacterium]
MELLELLADGQFHSGQHLGAQLGVSRAAVWKQINRLREKGAEIDVVHGRGYRLSTFPVRWSASAIRGHMSSAALVALQRIEIVQCVSSTNDVVMTWQRDKAGSGLCCIAEEQTHGRGRRGRDWLSPPGACFYGTVGWTFERGFGALEGLSLAIGVAVVRALKRLGVQDVSLKWPNDIEINGAKLGGVLIEAQAEAGGACHAAIGIGLNISLPPDFAQKVGRPVADLSSYRASGVSRDLLAALLLDEILLLLQAYDASGFRLWQGEWMALDSLQGHQVVVTGMGDPVMGVARGVDAGGALLIETPFGLNAVHAGEVSLRKA